jgi:hypothetical protein
MTLVQILAKGYSFAARPHWYANNQQLCINIKTMEYVRMGVGTDTRPSQETRSRCDFKPCSYDGVIIDKYEVKKEKEMSKDVNYVGGEYKVVGVKYVDSSLTKYYFKIDADIEVEEGTLLVVEDKNGYGIANVVEVVANSIENADAIAKATAWVVDVIDTSRQDERKDATKKRKYIIQQLEERKKAMEAVSVYQALANVDETSAKLLEELKSLGGVK